MHKHQEYFTHYAYTSELHMSDKVDQDHYRTVKEYDFCYKITSTVDVDGYFFDI